MNRDDRRLIPIQPASLLQNLVEIRKEGVLERGAEGHWRVGSSHANDGTVQVFEDALRNTDREFSRETGGAGVLVNQQHLRRLLDARATGVAIEGEKRA